MTIASDPKLTLLLVLLPLACGERSVPLLDGSSALPDAVVTADAGPSADSTVVPPKLDGGASADGLLPSPDLGSPDLGPAPCCKPPVCVHKGSYSEGWSDPCNSQPVKLGYCSSCEVGCKDCGPGCKANGYYTYCPSLKLIRACACKACKPECRYIGSNSEGWYDPCTNKLIAWASCSVCKVLCVDPSQPRMGVPQPRYYSSCDKTKPLTKALCIP